MSGSLGIPIRDAGVRTDGRPCVLFDSHHPKHYLTVRSLGQRCRDHGLDVVWTARDKDVLVTLMRDDGLMPFALTRAQPGLVRKLGELLLYDWGLLAIARRYRPLAMVGKTVSLTHVGRILGIPSILINDDSARQNPQYRYLGYPFATRILSSEALDESYGPRQRSYPGLMELAYLHPATFTPDPAIRTELGVGPDERVFVIRRAAFGAYHDVGQLGISEELLTQIIDLLKPHGRTFIVSESPLNGSVAEFRLPVRASRLHHVLAIADIVLGDGLTVCVEAALLGRPAVVFGPYVDRLAYLRTLADRFGLIETFAPGQEADLLARLNVLLHDREKLARWTARRAAMLAQWSDPTDVYWEELCAAISRPVSGRLQVSSPLPEIK